MNSKCDFFTLCYLLFLVHQWLIEQDLEQFFKKSRYSLLNVQDDLSPERLNYLYGLIENRTVEELGYKRNINYDAAKCMMYGDFEKAHELILAALQVDPFCIHALCNKGTYLLQQGGNISDVETVALEMLKQYHDESGKQRLYAKVDYAYWLAEVVRSEGAREQSCGIFEECIEKAAACADGEALKAYCSYFYVKILVRMVREKNTTYNQIRFQVLVEKIGEQFVVLAKADRKAYGGDLWLWIAELQTPRILKRCPHAVGDVLKTLVSKCSVDLGRTNFKPETCLNAAYVMRHEFAYDRKLVMRIGKLCLDMAYQEQNVGIRVHWFEKARDLSEECSQASEDWYFMCASTSSQAYLNLWAIKFYNDNKEAVKRQYIHFTQRKGKVRFTLSACY